MMMALVVTTVSVAVLMAGVPSATAEPTWILGDMGEACKSVCARNGNKNCIADVQSTVINKWRFSNALYETGHQMCKRVIARKYAWGPFVADGGKTCVYLTPGSPSDCNQPKEPSHRPLCFCAEPVDCVWSKWNNGTCSQTCGNGIRFDDRFQNPAAHFGGLECEGSSRRKEICVNKACEPDCKNTDFKAKSNDPGAKEIALKDSEGNGCSWYEQKPDYCGSYDSKEFQANSMCCVCAARETCTDTDNGEKDKSGRGCSEYQRSWCGTLDSDTFNSGEMCCACKGEEDTKQDEEQKTGQGD